MDGVITTRHLLTHGALIIRRFGLRCYTRCVLQTLFLRRRVTFLDCMRDSCGPCADRGPRR